TDVTIQTGLGATSRSQERPNY
ncbi:hypothetical protein CCACVL1_19636, partial [Corchorus capsularis]